MSIILSTKAITRNKTEAINHKYNTNLRSNYPQIIINKTNQ